MANLDLVTERLATGGDIPTHRSAGPAKGRPFTTSARPGPSPTSGTRGRPRLAAAAARQADSRRRVVERRAQARWQQVNPSTWCAHPRDSRGVGGVCDGGEDRPRRDAD